MLPKHKVERSQSTHAILDEKSRIKKADKIIKIVSQYQNLESSSLLDIGTGSGHISYEFSRNAKSVASVDVTDERHIKEGYSFDLVENEKLPYENLSFDIVVSNHIVEHVQDQDLHLKEAMRVLKPNGVLYLATPNKLWLTDPHYKLPLLNWMPRKLSNAGLKLVSRGKHEWDIYPLSHFEIKKKLSKFELKNELPFLTRNSQRLSLDTDGKATRILSKLPTSFDTASIFYSPTLIYTVRHR